MRVLGAYRREQNANNVDVVAHHEDVGAVEEARVAEGQDEEREVEDHREDEVRDADPEERLEPVVVRVYSARL